MGEDRYLQVFSDQYIRTLSLKERFVLYCGGYASNTQGILQEARAKLRGTYKKSFFQEAGGLKPKDRKDVCKQ